MYGFCLPPTNHNTMTRLKRLTALAVDPESKHQTLELAGMWKRRLEKTEIERSTDIRGKMDKYHAAKRRLCLAKDTTEYEKDLYGEVI